MEDRIPNDRMQQLLGSELSRQDTRDTIRRMLAGSLRQPPPPAPLSRPLVGFAGETPRYDEAFHKTEVRLTEAQSRVRRERSLAAVQWASLEGHPPARRLVMVRNDERLHHWGLFDLLLDRSRDTVETDGAAALSLAELALAVAERLDADIYGAERVADFKTAALAALGDARRLNGDFAGARLAFSQARMHLEMGTGDILEEAGLLGGLVNLLCDLGEFEKAAHSLDRASALYRRMGDDRLHGVTVIPPQAEEEDGGLRQGLQRR